jgi:hypothetical protein
VVTRQWHLSAILARVIGSIPSKLAQLAVLPTVLVVVALTVPARHPSAAARSVGTSAATAPPEADASFFAAGVAPGAALDLAKAPRAGEPALARGWFQVTVIGAWPDAAATERAASVIRSLLATSARHHEDPTNAGARARLLDEANAAPVTPGEALELQRLGLTSEIGVGWPGASADAGGAVLVFGRALAVPGLKGDFGGLRPNPLVALLERHGARVFVEGDPAAPRPACFDVAFVAPDAAAAQALGVALSDYFAIAPALTVRPPWHPKGVSADEARARATYTALERAVRAALQDPAALRALRYFPGREPEDFMVELQRAYQRAALDAVDRVASDGDRDAEVVDAFRRALPALPFHGPAVHDSDPASRARLLERLGGLAAEVSTRGAGAAELVATPAEVALGASGRARVDGRKVDLGGLSFHRVARGLPLLLDWLRRARCSDVRLDVTAPGRLRDALEHD